MNLDDVEGPIGVACSGGADSIALLHLLVEAGHAPVVLHVDHGLRPDSSDDAAFVERVAAELGLDFELLTVTVPESDSIEAAARDVRYGALEGAAERLGLRWVLTAHTKDDDAETVLLRLMRGTGVEGIAPERGIFLRPLLDTKRDELRRWLVDRGIAWREDPTNVDTKFERNWLRNEILPLLEARRPGVADVVARVGARTRADAHALDDAAAEVFHSSAAVDHVGVFVPDDDWPDAIRWRVIRLAYREIGIDPTRHDLERVTRIDDGLVFLRHLPAAGAPPEAWGLRTRIGSPDASPWRWRTPVPDAATHLRPRRPGDRVAAKKVKDVLIDAKVPRALRDFVPIVASADGALAVVPLARCDVDAVMVLDVEPFHETWSTKLLWNRP